MSAIDMAKAELLSEFEGLEYEEILSQDILKDVLFELWLANKKFPPVKSLHEGYAILLEEVDELWNEVKFGDSLKDLKLEAWQVTAMALKLLQYIESEEDKL